jgi:hypothetical protein
MMALRLATLWCVFCFVGLVSLETRSFAVGKEPGPLNFGDLPGDEQVSDYLKAVSPTYREAYDAILKRAYVDGIEFKSVPFEPLKFGELGVFFVEGVFEIRISDKLTGAERVKTLAFEVANAYFNEEHRQIDAGAASGFFDAREFAIAHEIYEYEAWRLYHRFVLDLERELGEGNLPAGLFYGTAASSVADYKLPPLFHYLKHMEESQHMKHYLDWFEKHYAKQGRQERVGEPADNAK